MHPAQVFATATPGHAAEDRAGRSADMRQRVVAAMKKREKLLAELDQFAATASVRRLTPAETIRQRVLEVQAAELDDLPRIFEVLSRESE